MLLKFIILLSVKSKPHKSKISENEQVLKKLKYKHQMKGNYFLFRNNLTTSNNNSEQKPYKLNQGSDSKRLTCIELRTESE